MLLDVTLSNYRSFKDEAQFSFVRPALRTETPRQGQTWQDVTYRVAALYGANAAGKSTLLEAVGTLAGAIAEPRSALHVPYALDAESRARPTCYGVNFTVDGVRYHYEVVAEAWGISHEALHAYPRGTRRHLFTRTQVEGGEPQVKAGSALTGPTAEVRKITTSTALFLATALEYGHKSLAPVARALRLGAAIKVVRHDDHDQYERLQWMMARMAEDPRQWGWLSNAIARMADLGIVRVEVRDREIPPEVMEMIRHITASEEGEAEIPEEALAALRRSLVFVHRGQDGQEYELGLGAQSRGTVTWLASVGPALEALRKGHTVVIDELDASLHPTLAATLIELFKDPQHNISGAQLLLTTHDTSLLGNVPMRLLDPGEVWFVDKDDAGVSDLAQLSDFDTRSGNNEQKRYLSGRFGALPRVDLSALLRGEAGAKSAGAA